MARNRRRDVLTKVQATKKWESKSAKRKQSNSDDSSSEDEESTTEESQQVSASLQALHSDQLTSTTMIASSAAPLSAPVSSMIASSSMSAAAAAAYPSHGGMMTSPAVTGLSSMGAAAAAAAAYPSPVGMQAALSIIEMNSLIPTYNAVSSKKSEDYLYLLLREEDVDNLYQNAIIKAKLSFLTFFENTKPGEKSRQYYIFRTASSEDEIWKDIGSSPCFFLGTTERGDLRERKHIKKQLNNKTLSNISTNHYQFFIPDSISMKNLEKLKDIATILGKRYEGIVYTNEGSFYYPNSCVGKLECIVKKQDGTKEKMTLQELLDARLPKVTKMRADDTNSFYVVSKMKRQSAIVNPVCQQTLSTLFQLVDAQFVDNLSQFQETLMYDGNHAFVGFSVSAADKEVAIKQLRQGQLSFDNAIYYFPKEDDLTLEDLILLMRLQQVNIPDLKIAIAKPDKTYELRSIKEMTLTIQSYQKTIINGLPSSPEKCLLTLFQQQGHVVAEQQQSTASTIQSSHATSTIASAALFGGSSSLSSNMAAAAAAAAPASSSMGP